MSKFTWAAITWKINVVEVAGIKGNLVTYLSSRNRSATAVETRIIPAGHWCRTSSVDGRHESRPEKRQYTAGWLSSANKIMITDSVTGDEFCRWVAAGFQHCVTQRKSLSTLSQKSATVAENGETTAKFGDCRTFLRQCGQALKNGAFWVNCILRGI